jgi:RES domain-containing protein
MARFFRIVQTRWIDTALSEEGARRYGGRWNKPGTPAVYLAESRALAVLEILVHAPREALRLDWTVIQVEIDDADVETKEITSLPENWSEMPSSQSARAFGDFWIVNSGRLALKVPSAVIPEESALVVNPAHSKWAQLKPIDVKPFRLDGRL